MYRYLNKYGHLCVVNVSIFHIVMGINKNNFVCSIKYTLLYSIYNIFRYLFLATNSIYLVKLTQLFQLDKVCSVINDYYSNKRTKCITDMPDNKAKDHVKLVLVSKGWIIT